MAVEQTFRAVIAVDDRTAALLRRIQASLAGIGQNTGLVRLGAVAQRLGASMAGLGRATAALAVPMAALGTTAIIAAGAGLVSMVNQTIEAGDNLSALSDQLGISVGRIQELNYAALQSNVSQEAMTNALSRLGRGMHEAATGGNRDLLALFTRMEIPLRDSRGGLRSMADVLPELAQAFKNTENPTLRLAAAQVIFGRGGRELLPLLVGGREGLEALAARFRELGGAINDETTPRLAAADSAMNDMRTAMAGLRDAIVVQLTPALGPLLTELATFIGRNREFISLHVEAGFKAIAEALRGIDWAATRQGISDFIGLARSAYEAVGGWKNILIGFGAALAAPFVAASLSITTSLGGIALAMGAASPIGLAIIGIGAAAALIITQWEPIKAFFSGLWGRLASGWDEAWARMKPQFEVFASIVRAIADGIESLTKLIPNIPSLEPRTPEAQQQQRGNFGRRGAAGGFYSGPAEDPDGPDAIRQFPAPPPRMDQPRRGSLRLRMPQAPLVDPDTGAPLSATNQSLWSRPDAATAREGTLKVEVDFNNLPSGARVKTETTGNASRQPTLNVGYARLGVDT